VFVNTGIIVCYFGVIVVLSMLTCGSVYQCVLTALTMSDNMFDFAFVQFNFFTFLLTVN